MPTLDTPDASLLYSRAGTGPPVLLIQGVGVVDLEIVSAGHGLPIHRAAEVNDLLAEHFTRAELASGRCASPL